jgi:hypothetical protein
MPKQLHQRFSTQEVKEVFKKYESKIFSLEEVIRFLKISDRRFFVLLKKYRNSPETFSIEYARKNMPHKIDSKAEKKILSELEKEAALIADERNPIQFFNYSYVKNILEEKHDVKVSLPTVISRAKKMGFIKRKKLEKSMTEKF